MSDRERWIVYPLLFFCLMLGARDRLLPPNPLECDQLVCRSLLVKSIDDRPVIRLNSTLEGGYVRMYSMEPASTDRLELAPTKIRQTVELGAHSEGGYVTLFGPKSVPAIKLGHHSEMNASGLVATSKNGETIKSETSPQEPWGSLLPWESSSDEEGDETDDSAETHEDAADSAN